MKKFILSLLAAFLLLPLTAKAMDFEVDQPRPTITSVNLVEVNKNIIFDASSTILPDTEAPATYEWDLGDGSVPVKGEEVVHTYEKPGRYVVTLTVSQQGEEASVAKELFVYKNLILLLTDVTDKQENIENLRREAEEIGTYIYLIESYESTTAFMSEESLYKKLSDQVFILKNADAVAIWTTRSSGINALTRLAQTDPETTGLEITESLKEKTIVVVSDEGLNTLARIMQGSFNIIKPKRIVLTRQYELNNLVVAPTAEEFVQGLEKGVSEYRIIDAKTARVSFLNSISYLVNFMITKGIPSNTIVLLLMLPVIATLITFLKQVIGITTFGLYTPSIITLSFLALGLKFGLSILIIIIVTGAILRKILDRFRLLHIPRIAIILTISTLIILLMLAFGTYLGISQIATIAVFPMLIMTTLAEKFVNAMSGKGYFAALLLMLETTVVSLICYWVVELPSLQTLILGHPEIILLLLVVNYVLGRWTGLRLMEYVRFREVMKHAEE